MWVTPMEMVMKTSSCIVKMTLSESIKTMNEKCPLTVILSVYGYQAEQKTSKMCTNFLSEIWIKMAVSI